MNEITIKQSTISSVEVADMVGKDHNMLLRDIRRYANQLGQSKIAQSDFFQESTYMNSQNREMPCYNVTKKGCEFIGNKLTGIKGAEFTAKYINRFHEMEEILVKPLTLEQMMRIQLQMVDKHEVRIERLENTMTIDYGQQQVLKERINSIVVNWLGGKSSQAYKEMSKVVFSEINRDFQRYFNVNSRNNTPKLRFDDALSYIDSWEPCSNTKLKIKECNLQMSFL
jgi:Rha family phage regulatory protein